MYLSLPQPAENVSTFVVQHVFVVLVVFALDSTGNVPFFLVQHAVLVLVVSVLDSAENVPSFAVQHVFVVLVVSVLDSAENVPSFAVLALVAHEFSFAECDDDEKKQIFVLLGSLHVQPAFV